VVGGVRRIAEGSVGLYAALEGADALFGPHAALQWAGRGFLGLGVGLWWFAYQVRRKYVRVVPVTLDGADAAEKKGRQLQR